jgi:hypothetical protein
MNHPIDLVTIGAGLETGQEFLTILRPTAAVAETQAPHGFLRGPHFVAGSFRRRNSSLPTL